MLSIHLFEIIFGSSITSSYIHARWFQNTVAMETLMITSNSSIRSLGHMSMLQTLQVLAFGLTLHVQAKKWCIILLEETECDFGSAKEVSLQHFAHQGTK